ncbi:hypothetical protein QR680_016198 [Steinernema hermaphroditum]|uniref:Saposin B-type domain-containing protein n=1 Tax=Steinernema hermaphroditum TaxID=289476 RepID=A0AA39LM21_9BILA|nr:hypothetical protein QR680_016198 [Steinernema hermaphroditum]
MAQFLLFTLTVLISSIFIVDATSYGLCRTLEVESDCVERITGLFCNRSPGCIDNVIAVLEAHFGDVISDPIQADQIAQDVVESVASIMYYKRYQFF